MCDFRIMVKKQAISGQQNKDFRAVIAAGG